MYKECDVIMLATNNEANNCLMIKFHQLSYNKGYFTKSYLNSINAQPQHLYILSDDEIKEGDWCMDIDTDGRARFLKICKHGALRSDLKIIASTDSSLNIQFTDGSGSYTMPSIPQSFIDKYVSEYNKGNKIEKVIVEYQEKDISNDYSVGLGDEKIKPILTDNTININSIKDSWTKDEVISLMLEALHMEFLGHPFDKEWINSKL